MLGSSRPSALETMKTAMKTRPPADQVWWVVTRRYTVEDVVYVEADNASEAKIKARDGDYDDIGEAETVSATTYRRALRIPGGKPKHLWDSRDYEARAIAEEQTPPMEVDST